MKTVKTLLNHFIPTVCPACLCEPVSGHTLCIKCLSGLNLAGENQCRYCGGNVDLVLDICSKCMKEDTFPWDNAMSLFELKGDARKIIQQLKYNNRLDLVPFIGDMAAEKISSTNIKFDYIIPVPLHKIKKLIRGFNQSYLISKVISKKTGIPCRDWLVRTRYTASQTKLTKDKRRKNLINVFSTSKRAFLKNKDILLVDDVMTTGSTLRSATETLLSAGAERVSILVIARR